jgi:hypothetical protein
MIFINQQILSGNRIKVDELGETCSRHGRRYMHIGFGLGNLKKNFKDLSVDNMTVF